MGYTTYELLWLFFAYSVLGWALGVAMESLKRKTFINAGVMSLPLCPVYGVGAVVNAIFLKELKGTPVFLFIGGMLLLAFLTIVSGLDSADLLRHRFFCCTEQVL